MTIEGRKIAITGAARGLGKALAIVAADRGAILSALSAPPNVALRQIVIERTGTQFLA